MSEHSTTATQSTPKGSESKHDRSARLTTARLERWSQTNYKVREHFRRHFRYLTEAEVDVVAEFMRAETESLIEVLRGSEPDQARELDLAE